MSKKHKRKFPFKRFVRLFLTYFILFVAIFGLIDYYAYMEFNFLYFIIVSAFIALPTAYLHIKYGKKSHIDDVSKELF